jgi:hypothetical protein
VQNLLRREADIAIRFFRPEQDDVIAISVGQTEIGLFGSKELVDSLPECCTPGDLKGRYVGGVGVEQAIEIAAAAGHSLQLSDFRFRSMSSVAHRRRRAAGRDRGRAPGARPRVSRSGGTAHVRLALRPRGPAPEPSDAQGVRPPDRHAAKTVRRIGKVTGKVTWPPRAAVGRRGPPWAAVGRFGPGLGLHAIPGTPPGPPPERRLGRCGRFAALPAADDASRCGRRRPAPARWSDARSDPGSDRPS